MADRKGKAQQGGQGAKSSSHLAQFKYAAMSNLVLQADKRFVSRRNEESTGDPESLAGRISIRDMGSRTMRDAIPVQKRARLQGAEIERGGYAEGANVLRQQGSRGAEKQKIRGSGILSQQDLLVEGLKYRPRTQGTQETYNLITIIVARNLGDVPNTVIRSAADAVLEYLKDGEMKDFDKKKEIDDILGVTMGSKEFNDLVNLGKKITDYDAQDEDEAMGDAGDGLEDELDDKQGVAVVFDDEEDEEEAG
jgi:pre-mRNA-splicing helicase BRR2